MTVPRAVPISLKELNELVARLHRHHPPVQGHRFSIGAANGDRLVGGCSVGRPVARLTDQRYVAEVTRLVTDGTPNACSFLYGAAARACKAMGYWRIQTFILDAETGTSLRAAGWVLDGMTKDGDSWSGRAGSPIVDRHPTCAKARYVRTLNEAPAQITWAQPDDQMQSCLFSMMTKAAEGGRK